MTYPHLIPDALRHSSATACPIKLEAGHHGPAIDLPRDHLYRLALMAGGYFRSLGVRAGDRIVTFLPTGRPLLQAIFGAWTVGAVICVMAPSIGGGPSTLSLERTSEMLSIVLPSAIIADGDDFAALQPLADRLGAPLTRPSDLPLEWPGRLPEAVHLSATDPALIQFTSGSTGLPKACVIAHGQLADNARLSAQRFEFDEQDTFCSWLPLHHDFGFVVQLSMPILIGAGLIIIPTDAFTRNPFIWLRALTESRATISASPPSGLAIFCRSAFRRKACDFDLSALTCIWLGAEPIGFDLCREFAALYNLREGVLSPAYGMAETTLTVTGNCKFEVVKHLVVGTDVLQKREGIIADAPPGGETVALLSNGIPIPGVRIEICDPEGKALPERHLGEILVSSPMTTKSYFGSSVVPQDNGWFATGDIGFLAEGELYITGRIKDVLIKNGMNMPAHIVEDTALAAFPDVLVRAVAFSVPNSRDLRDEVILGVETRNRSTDRDLPTAIRASVQVRLNFSVDVVLILPKGSIPRTTSGKTQRLEARNLYRSGKLVPGAIQEMI